MSTRDFSCFPNAPAGLILGNMRSTPLLLVLSALALVSCAQESQNQPPVPSASVTFLKPPSVNTVNPEIVPEFYDSSLATVDANWNLYTNKTLAFSLKLPKGAWNGYQISEVKTFDDTRNLSVYVSTQTYGPNGDVTDFPAVFQAQDPATVPPFWQIIAEDSPNLQTFVRQHFGTGCTLGTIEKLPGGIGVKAMLATDGKNPDQTSCKEVMANPVFFFDARYHRAIYWYLGGDVQFLPAPEAQDASDKSMLESFRFVR
jgi:hypothetical protein